MFKTVDELAELFKVKKSTIYDWVHFKKIGYSKIGGLRFSQEHINDFLIANSKIPKKRAVVGKRRRTCRIPAETLRIMDAAQRKVLHSDGGFESPVRRRRHNEA